MHEARKLPIIREMRLETALIQFIFPFSLNRDSQNDLKTELEHDGYAFFSLDKLELEEAFYGKRHKVSHRSMERYYLPFANNVLFAKEEDPDGFQRYSKALDMECEFKTAHGDYRPHIHSVDVILCPFDLGFITIRTELPAHNLTFTEAIEFASRFRVLQNITVADDATSICYDNEIYDEIEAFIFKVLAPGMLKYLDTGQLKEAYFEKLPFFVDERMYVQAFLAADETEEISQVDLYRASHLDGVNHVGEPFLSASNMEYIEAYCQKHVYDRWAPRTYFINGETSFICLTNQAEEVALPLANQTYGEYYYGLLLNLFHKIVLLKLSHRYSHVRLERNQDEIEELIRSITAFSSKYYFIEVVSQSQGKEIFFQLKRRLANQELFEDVKQTLDDLFRYQANFTSRQSGYLLMILTIYTVISGIYGMNQVIEDLKGNINWKKMTHYSVFEYIALVVTVTGIIVAFALGIRVLLIWSADWKKRRQFMRPAASGRKRD
jgi:hypothetical protein